MIIVTGRVVMADGGVEKLRPAMKAMLAASCAEEGCLEYAYGADMSDPNVFLILEKWESWEALEAHFQTPHLQRWRSALTEAGLVSRDLVAADASAMKAV